jgi:CMP-N-acetylneuraminic acid synthetase
MDKYTAVIPVRKDSRRLKNKNIAPFAGSTLLEHKINVLKSISVIDNIVVSSDCDTMLSIADSLGLETHKRNPEYCDEKTKPFGSVVKHICEKVASENIIWSPVTAPLVTIKTYCESINEYEKYVLNENKFNSLITVYPFKNYLLNKSGPINYEYGLKHIPSQNLEEIYLLTAGIFIANRQDMIKWSYLNGDSPYMKSLSRFESVDIDDEYDLDLASFYYEKYMKDIFIQEIYFE